MKFLLIGKGGREHAIAWKLMQSKVVTELFLWPGNPGMNHLPDAVFVDQGIVSSHADIVQYCMQQQIDVVVVGPEGPLAEGIADEFSSSGIRCFGPKKGAALLESSKAFSKEVLDAAGIPTASHNVARSRAECESYANERFNKTGGVVLKASGLAAGKGVFVCSEQRQLDAAYDMLYGSFSEAAETVVVEELMIGRECSYFCCLGSGEHRSLGFAVDFKRLEEQDQGPNTGGMGCYTPVPWLPVDAEAEVRRKVIDPLLKELELRGIEYTGFLYVGLMWTKAGPKVVEFNVRLGDPEAQVMAISSKLDWGEVILEKVGLVSDQSSLNLASPAASDSCAVGVVMASESYPYGKDVDPSQLPRQLFDGNQTSQVFAASISADDEGNLLTGSGRVLTVTGCAEDFRSARNYAYKGVDEVAKHWPRARWRRDIAKRVSDEKSNHVL